MKVTLTEEAKNMLIPLIFHTKHGGEIVSLSPAELLTLMEAYDQRVTFLSRKVGKWQGIAAGIAIGAGYFIWRSMVIEDECKKLNIYNENLREELRNERES